MEQLINNSKKMTALLIELREAKIYESKKYHFLPDPSNKGMYFLYLIQGKKLLIYGTESRINSYKRLRNIQDADIYTAPIN